MDKKQIILANALRHLNKPVETMRQTGKNSRIQVEQKRKEEAKKKGEKKLTPP